MDGHATLRRDMVLYYNGGTTTCTAQCSNRTSLIEFLVTDIFPIKVPEGNLTAAVYERTKRRHIKNFISVHVCTTAANEEVPWDTPVHLVPKELFIKPRGEHHKAALLLTPQTAELPAYSTAAATHVPNTPAGRGRGRGVGGRGRPRGRPGKKVAALAYVEPVAATDWDEQSLVDSVEEISGDDAEDETMSEEAEEESDSSSDDDEEEEEAEEEAVLRRRGVGRPRRSATLSGRGRKKERRGRGRPPEKDTAARPKRKYRKHTPPSAVTAVAAPSTPPSAPPLALAAAGAEGITVKRKRGRPPKLKPPPTAPRAAEVESRSDAVSASSSDDGEGVTSGGSPSPHRRRREAKAVADARTLSLPAKGKAEGVRVGGFDEEEVVLASTPPAPLAPRAIVCRRFLSSSAEMDERLGSHLLGLSHAVYQDREERRHHGCVETPARHVKKTDPEAEEGLTLGDLMKREDAAAPHENIFTEETAAAARRSVRFIPTALLEALQTIQPTTNAKEIASSWQRQQLTPTVLLCHPFSYMALPHLCLYGGHPRLRRLPPPPADVVGGPTLVKVERREEDTKKNEEREADGDMPLLPSSVSFPFVVGGCAQLNPGGTKEQSHRWTVYVRGLYHSSGGGGVGEDGDYLSQFIERVTFILDRSFAQCVHEVHQPPFEVTQLGWGEFVVSIHIHLRYAAYSRSSNRPRHKFLHYLCSSGGEAAFMNSSGPGRSCGVTDPFTRFLLRSGSAGRGQHNHPYTNADNQMVESLHDVNYNGGARALLYRGPTVEPFLVSCSSDDNDEEEEEKEVEEEGGAGDCFGMPCSDWALLQQSSLRQQYHRTTPTATLLAPTTSSPVAEGSSSGGVGMGWAGGVDGSRGYSGGDDGDSSVSSPISPPGSLSTFAVDSSDTNSTARPFLGSTTAPPPPPPPTVGRPRGTFRRGPGRRPAADALRHFQSDSAAPSNAPRVSLSMGLAENVVAVSHLLRFSERSKLPPAVPPLGDIRKEVGGPHERGPEAAVGYSIVSHPVVTERYDEIVLPLRTTFRRRGRGTREEEEEEVRLLRKAAAMETRLRLIVHEVLKRMNATVGSLESLLVDILAPETGSACGGLGAPTAPPNPAPRPRRISCWDNVAKAPRAAERELDYALAFLNSLSASARAEGWLEVALRRNRAALFGPASTPLSVAVFRQPPHLGVSATRISLTRLEYDLVHHFLLTVPETVAADGVQLLNAFKEGYRHLLSAAVITALDSAAEYHSVTWDGGEFSSRVEEGRCIMLCYLRREQGVTDGRYANVTLPSAAGDGVEPTMYVVPPYEEANELHGYRNDIAQLTRMKALLLESIHAMRREMSFRQVMATGRT